MYISKSRLLLVNIFVSASIFFLACSIPQTGKPNKFSPILVRRYNAEINLGKEQISNDPQLAIEYFNSAIEKNLNWPEAFAGRGMAWLNLTKFALAIKDFDMALEADWASVNRHEYNVGKSTIYLHRAIARMGFFVNTAKTIDTEKNIGTWVLTYAEIDGDLNLAELHAGFVSDHELIKTIIETRHSLRIKSGNTFYETLTNALNQYHDRKERAKIASPK